MTKRSHRPDHTLPLMMGGLMAASWETIYRRSLLMAQGACSAAEYQLMVAEKLGAMEKSAFALMTGRGHKAALAPYFRAARANAKWLRSGS